MFMIYGSRQLLFKLPDVRLSLTEWALTRNSRHQILKTVSSFMSSPAQISSVKGELKAKKIRIFIDTLDLAQ